MGRWRGAGGHLLYWEYRMFKNQISTNQIGFKTHNGTNTKQYSQFVLFTVNNTPAENCP